MLQCSPEDMASSILQSIHDFVQKAEPQSLRLVRLTIYQQSMVDVFIKAMKELAHKKKGLWGEQRVKCTRSFGATVSKGLKE